MVLTPTELWVQDGAYKQAIVQYIERKLIVTL